MLTRTSYTTTLKCNNYIQNITLWPKAWRLYLLPVTSCIPQIEGNPPPLNSCPCDFSSPFSRLVMCIQLFPQQWCNFMPGYISPMYLNGLLCLVPLTYPLGLALSLSHPSSTFSEYFKKKQGLFQIHLSIPKTKR